jgi:hypothetical protein
MHSRPCCVRSKRNDPLARPSLPSFPALPEPPAPHLSDTGLGAYPRQGQTWDLPVPAQRASTHASVSDHAGPAAARSNASRRIAFRLRNDVGVRDRIFSGLNGWPVHSPADASPPPSRATAHGVEPMWIATPSSCRTCTNYSLPVSLAHCERFGTLSRSTQLIKKV